MNAETGHMQEQRASLLAVEARHLQRIYRRGQQAVRALDQVVLIVRRDRGECAIALIGHLDLGALDLDGLHLARIHLGQELRIGQVVRRVRPAATGHHAVEADHDDDDDAPDHHIAEVHKRTVPKEAMRPEVRIDADS